jgi:hypothetical protein
MRLLPIPIATLVPIDAAALDEVTLVAGALCRRASVGVWCTDQDPLANRQAPPR